MAPEPRPGWVHADGARLHHLDWGGEGASVVFLPGAGLSAHVYRDLAPLLGDGFRSLALSPRGHGESETPSTGYAVGDFTRDLRAALDALGVTRAALVAHSLAGPVAARLALEDPGRVSHLVLLDGVVDYPGLGRVRGRNPAPPPPPPPPGSAPAAERDWHGRYALGAWTPAAEADWAARSTGPAAALRHDLVGLYAADAVTAPPPWGALRCPLLALVPRESVESQFPWLEPGDPRRARAAAYLREVRLPWRQGAVERFRRAAPEARVVAVPGNHYFFLAHPRRVADEIRAFLLAPPSSSSPGTLP